MSLQEAFPFCIWIPWHKKKIMSSDKALESYKEKGIHWNPNLTKCTGIGTSAILNDFHLGVSTSLP